MLTRNEELVNELGSITVKGRAKGKHVKSCSAHLKKKGEYNS